MLWPFVFVSLLELMSFQIDKSHLFAYARIPEAHRLFVPHALLLSEPVRMLWLPVLLAILACDGYLCRFLLGFTFVVTRRVAAASLAACCNAPGGLNAPFVVAMDTIDYPHAVLLRAVKPVLRIIVARGIGIARLSVAPTLLYAAECGFVLADRVGFTAVGCGCEFHVA